MHLLVPANATARPRTGPFVGALLLALSFGGASAAVACERRTVVRDAATAGEVASFIASQPLTLLSFVGYSGAGYENESAMLAQADEVLARFDPARTMVNIGATAQGIGAVYELARRRGYFTLGIVSSLARDEGERLSPCVDLVVFVRDTQWGGRLPGSPALSPTSTAIVENSMALVGIGGGDIARDELLAARAARKPVTFYPADMNHRIAREKAAAKGLSEPVDFRSAAEIAFPAGR